MMIVKILNSPILGSFAIYNIILGDVIFYKQTIILFFRRFGYFYEIGKSQKSVARKDRRSVFKHFSAKNIPLKNDENP